MSMHPFAESNVATARHDIRRVIECLEEAVRVGAPMCWVEIGIALSRAKYAAAHLDSAMGVEELLSEMAVTAGGGE